MKLKVLLKFVGVFSIIIILGCNPSKRNWENAVQQNTISGYEEFLQKYPESEFAKVAAQRYDSLDWVQTLSFVDSTKMSEYVVNHPQGKYVGNAKLLLDSLEWESALSYKDTSHIRALIKNKPDNKFNEKGLQVIWEVKWPPVEVNKVNSIYIAGKAGGEYFGELIFHDDNFGIGAFAGGSGPVQICIWRNFYKQDIEKANRLGLLPGIAYLKVSKGDFKFVKRINLEKSNEELCNEFRINSESRWKVFFSLSPLE